MKLADHHTLRGLSAQRRPRFAVTALASGALVAAAALALTGCSTGKADSLALAGATSMRAVGPGIANALVATALGLAAAIPAAVFYNHFGHSLKEIGARMEDFSLEFLNVAERALEE